MQIESQYNLGPHPLRTKVLDIGDWDMVATPSVSIAHGLTLAIIREVYATIRRDDDLQHFPLEYSIAGTDVAGRIYRDATDIILTRITGGVYDAVAFDLTPYNRGWIVVKYV